MDLQVLHITLKDSTPRADNQMEQNQENKANTAII